MDRAVYDEIVPNTRTDTQRHRTRRRRAIAVAAAVVGTLLLVSAAWVWTTHGSGSDKTVGNLGSIVAPGASTSASPQPSGSSMGSASASPSGSRSAPASPKPSTAKGPANAGPTGFPNASNTGVQAGVTLANAATDPDYSASKQLYFAQRAGQLVQNLDIVGSISVSASNVTIRNVRINCNNGALAGAIHQGLGAQNLTVEHVTIIGSATKECQYGILSAAPGTIIRSSNISLVTDAINPYGNVTVEDNFVHDLTFFSGDHVAAFGFDGGNAAPIVIRHNTFDDPNNDGNNLIALYSQNGPVINTTIDGNWLAGSGHIMWAGGYPADCSGSPGVHDVKITNNRFSTKYHPDGGSFSAVVGWCPAAPGNVWSENLWIDGPRAGQVVNPIP